MNTMYDRIRDLRIKNGMSQEDLAKKVGYKSRSMIARVEGGEVDISQKMIVAFSQALGVSTTYLMDGDEEEDQTEKLLQQVSEEERTLFRLARNAKPEAIRAAVAVLKSMQETNDDF